MWQYALALGLTDMWALLVGKRPAWICAAVLSGNFIVNEAFVRLTGIYTPWYWFTAADALAVIILTYPQVGTLGALLAATYLTQIVMHWGFAITREADPYFYWQALTAMAWLQLAILIVGAGYDHRDRLFDYLRRPAGPAAEARPEGARKAGGEEE